MSNIHYNLWPEITSFENILAAFYEARRTKRTRRQVLQSEFALEDEIVSIRRELCSGRYRPRPYHHFQVFEPKLRDILAPHWRDRIIQHALYRHIAPLFDRTFIDDSYACRPDKGLHYGLKRVRGFVRHACRERAPNTAHYLKLDIRRYFACVQWDVLLELLCARIGDAQVRELLRTIVTRQRYTSPPSVRTTVIDADKRRGMPIGNLTSQLFANLYLNPLDHFIKRDLKMKWYGRYMDDFVIIHPEKIRLQEARREIEHFLSEQLRLELHPHKVALTTLDKGIAFLGYHIFPNRVRVAAKTLRRSRRKLLAIRGQVARREIPPKALVSPWQSVRGFLRHADAYRVRERLAGELFDGTCYYLNAV